MTHTRTLGITLLLAGYAAFAQPAGQDPLSKNLFPPELVMQFHDELGLTEEQRDSLKAEMEQAQPRFKKMQQQLQEEVDKLAAILKDERISEKAALAQFDKVQDLERGIKRAHLALVIGLKNKLTPEQQAKLQEFKKKFTAGKMTEDLQKRLQGKMEKVKAGVEQWQSEGRDPSPVAEIMQEFEPLMKAGQFEKAEALLDRALKLLGADEKEKKSEAGGTKSAGAFPLRL